MYRKRRIRSTRRRRATAVAAFAAALVVSIGIPTLALGDPTDGLIKNLGVSGSGGSGGDVSGNAGVPSGSGYVPPLHGTNPHGQGTNVIADLQPSETSPCENVDGATPTPADCDEEIVVGQSTGYQDSNGDYHGRVELLWLFGNPVLNIESDGSGGGESVDGPLQPLNEGLANACGENNDQLCVLLLDMHSSSDDNSSDNSLNTLNVEIGPADETGTKPISVHVLNSEGNVSDDGSCSNANGDSEVLNANLGPLNADALHADSASTACNGNTNNTVTQGSTVLYIGEGPDEAADGDIPFPPGCDDESAENVVNDQLSPLLEAVCHASDSSTGGGVQVSGDSYGVREALTLFLLIMEDTAVLKVVGGAAESRAISPDEFPTTTTPTTTTGGGTLGGGGKGGGAGKDGAGGEGEGAGAGAGAAGEAAAGDGNLAFTGADLLLLALVGGALILGGFGLTRVAGRTRQTV